MLLERQQHRVWRSDVPHSHQEKSSPQSRRAQFVEKEKGARQDGLGFDTVSWEIALENLQPTLRNVGNAKSDRGGREPKASRCGRIGTIF